MSGGKKVVADYASVAVMFVTAGTHSGAPSTVEVDYYKPKFSFGD